MKKSDRDFLDRYHNMVSELENRPKTFRHLKQGDSFWYLRLSYRGNGKNTNKYTIANYTVHELTEYEIKVQDEQELLPKKYVIHSIRTFQKMTLYSSKSSDETGVWKEVTEPDSISFVYDDEMDSDVIRHDDNLCCYYTVLAFDKQKAIAAMKEHVQSMATSAQNSFEKFIKNFVKEQKDDHDKLIAEYNNILNELDNG